VPYDLAVRPRRRALSERADHCEDRYRYVIELGRALPPLPEASRTEANRVRGCASQVWLATEVKGATVGAAACLIFKGDSDAHMVRGLIAHRLLPRQEQRGEDDLSRAPHQQTTIQ
jgi:sulfur transfer protein SufE